MSSQRSLLVFLPDQHSVASLGCYGNNRIETPNVDSLAEEGVRFENAYCTQPVCTPSRSAILTGQYPHATGLTENNVPLPTRAQCLPELGDFSEYATAFMGKWDLGDEVFAQHGFETWVSIEDSYGDQYRRGSERTRSSYHQHLIENGFEPDQDDGTFSRTFAVDLPEEFTKTAFLADRAIEFIESHRDQPFILFVAPLPPHSPYSGPRNDQYEPSSIELPPNFEHRGFDDQSVKHQVSREASLPGAGAATWRELIARYYGLVSLVDTHVGRVLDALDDNGLLDHTVTAFTADHGDMMGHQGTIGKNVMFEQAVRVPWILRAPTIAGGRTITDPVSQIDLVPTLLDLLDQSIPDQLHGHSLLPFIQRDEPAPEQPYVVIEENGPDGNGIDRRKDSWPATGSRPQPDPDLVETFRGRRTEEEVLRAYLDPIRTVVSPDRMKLNYSREGDHELYDLEADPYETENLAATEGHGETIDELVDYLFDWQVRTRDPVYLP